MPDYYQAIGVPKTATAEESKYRFDLNNSSSDLLTPLHLSSQEGLPQSRSQDTSGQGSSRSEEERRGCFQSRSRCLRDPFKRGKPPTLRQARCMASAFPIKVLEIGHPTHQILQASGSRELQAIRASSLRVRCPATTICSRWWSTILYVLRPLHALQYDVRRVVSTATTSST